MLMGLKIHYALFVKMSESVCIINDYYNSPLVVRAIKSVINYVDKVVIVTSNVNPFRNLPDKPVHLIHFSLSFLSLFIISLHIKIWIIW